jgi:hypothetical protein
MFKNRLLNLTFIGFLASQALSACTMGFNKNGFYCTESGSANEETPSCFRSDPPLPKKETAAYGTATKKSDASAQQ